jgi:hypothetical protein
LAKAHQPPPFKIVVPEVKEFDRPKAYFILEHELRKIKIHVPLSELLKNEPFEKSIMKVLQPPTYVVTSDVIGMQDETHPLQWDQISRMDLIPLHPYTYP